MNLRESYDRRHIYEKFIPKFERLNGLNYVVALITPVDDKKNSRSRDSEEDNLNSCSKIFTGLLV